MQEQSNTIYKYADGKGDETCNIIVGPTKEKEKRRLLAGTNNCGEAQPRAHIHKYARNR